MNTHVFVIMHSMVNGVSGNIARYCVGVAATKSCAMNYVRHSLIKGNDYHLEDTGLACYYQVKGLPTDDMSVYSISKMKLMGAPVNIGVVASNLSSGGSINITNNSGHHC